MFASNKRVKQQFEEKKEREELFKMVVYLHLPAKWLGGRKPGW